VIDLFISNCGGDHLSAVQLCAEQLSPPIIIDEKLGMGSSGNDEGSSQSKKGTGTAHSDGVPLSSSLPSTGTVSGGAPAAAAATNGSGAKQPDVEGNSSSTSNSTCPPLKSRLGGSSENSGDGILGGTNAVASKGSGGAATGSSTSLQEGSKHTQCVGGTSGPTRGAFRGT
ncbi:unnamed protein product, partial [Sphacelaria rigidula]